MKKAVMRLKNPLRRAGISGILLFMSFIFYNFFAQFISIFPKDPILYKAMPIFYILIVTVFGVLFTYGFVVLGRRFKQPLLQFTSWFGIIGASIIAVILVLDYLASPVLAQPATGELNSLLPFLFIGFYFFAIVFGVYSVLLGVGLLRIKKKVKYAKYAGLLNILAGLTYFLLIGFLALIAADIICILMFFKESERFDK